MYSRRILSERPWAAWSLDTVAATYPDMAGGLNDASQVGSAVTVYPALVAGAGGSVIITDAATLEFPNEVFTNNRGMRSFTLETWIKPIELGGPILILGHDLNSGLIIDGQEIQFTVPFDVPVTCTYVFEDVETYHVVGVFDGAAVHLYVNGDLQDSVSLEQENVDNGFDTFPQDELITGDTLETGQLFALDSPAIYATALTPTQIQNHFRWGRAVATAEEIVGSSLGVWHSFTDPHADKAFVQEWDTQETWDATLHENVIITADGVLPADDENLDSLAGTVIVSVPLGVDGDVINAVKIDWVAEGNYTVETSLDGTTWDVVANHSLVPDIIAPFTVDGIFLQARITFTGGVADDLSIFRSLRLTVYATAFLSASNSTRIAEVSGNVILANVHNEPIEQNDLRGARIDGGSIEIDEDVDVDTPQDINAVELWVKFNVLSGAFYVVDTRSGSATTRPRIQWTGTTMQIDGTYGRLYINGVRTFGITDVTWAVDRWYHILFTSQAAFNDPIYLGRQYNTADDADVDMQVGHIAFYTDFPAITPAGVQFVRDHTSGSSASGTAITTTLAADVDAGNTLAVWFGFDNTGTSTPTINSVSVPSGETAVWTRVASHNSSTATSGSGVRGELWVIQTTKKWTSGTVITGTLSASPPRSTATCREFSGASVTIRGTAGTGTNASGSPSAATSGAALVAGDLVIGGATFESNTAPTADADTTNGSWSAKLDGLSNSGTSATSVSSTQQYKIVNAAGVQTYNPTQSSDSGAAVVGLVPDPNGADPNDFTATDIYNAYLGVTRFIIEDDAATVTEPADSVEMYAYEWVIEPTF